MRSGAPLGIEDPEIVERNGVQVVSLGIWCKVDAVMLCQGIPDDDGYVRRDHVLWALELANDPLHAFKGLREDIELVDKLVQIFNDDKVRRAH